MLLNTPDKYRGRLAPSPTGLLHLGHARTFWTAFERVQEAGGTLVLRNDDLDRERVRVEFIDAMYEDLGWLGIRWQEGPDVAAPHIERGAYGPYSQSARLERYRSALQDLLRAGTLYPCSCTRSELGSVVAAPHEFADAEPLYPGTCTRRMTASEIDTALALFDERGGQGNANWRFRTDRGEGVSFTDNNPAFGAQRFVAGEHFSDFIVWRRDGTPSYQLACAVDDGAMCMTEVVRGSDLLLSTARQMLLQRVLGLPAPQYFHCKLVLDSEGRRLAKRYDAMSIRALRQGGATPESLLLRGRP